MEKHEPGTSRTWPEQIRPARMRIDTTVLLSRGMHSLASGMVDISATGALVRRPAGWPGAIGETWTLDMVFDGDLNIHLDVRVVRLSRDKIGLAYTRIPEEKQVPLWNLLGGYADTLELWHD